MSILSWQWSLALIALFGMALAQTSTPKPATGTPSKAIAALAKLEGKPLDVALLSQLLEFHDAAFEVVQEELIVGRRKEVKASADAMFDSLGLETHQFEAWLRVWNALKPDLTQRALVRQDVQAIVDWGRGRVAAGHDMNMAADPDRSFLEAIILHHEGELELLKAAGRSSRPELRAEGQRLSNLHGQELTRLRAQLTNLH